MGIMKRIVFKKETGQYITADEKRFAESSARVTGSPKSAIDRFKDWMHSRGENYATLELKYYMDGEPYFSSGGAEMSLSDFLRREKELTPLTKHL